MNALAAALILAVSFLQPGARGAAQMAGSSQPISVTTAFSLCQAHPAAQHRLSVRGWFVPAAEYSTFEEGGLFASRQAVPPITDDHWDVNGRWRGYGALFAHITTRASLAPRTLTLHGQLDCASYRFQTDRDPFPPPELTPVYGTAPGRRPGAVTTWAIAGGLKLTLTIPRRSYPLNALARVSVSVENVSRHTVGYWIPGINLPGVASPQAEVLDDSEAIVFPPAMPYRPPLPGPAPGLEPLHPGQMIRGSEYIVVRGARIRASQQFTPTWSPTVRRALNTLRTHAIGVRLTAEAAPTLTLHETSQGPVVDVTRPTGVTGRMLRLNYADCGDGANGPQFDYSFGWVGSGQHLTPGCSPASAWHVRVAWLNHPVAALDYAPPFHFTIGLANPQVLHRQGEVCAPTSQVHVGEDVRFGGYGFGTEAAGNEPTCVSGTVRIIKNGGVLLTLPLQCTGMVNGQAFYMYADTRFNDPADTGQMTAMIQVIWQGATSSYTLPLTVIGPVVTPVTRTGPHREHPAAASTTCCAVYGPILS